MDIITTPPYKEMQELYRKYFSIAYISQDLSDKLALISLICYLKYKLSLKKPDVTHYQIVKKIMGDSMSEDMIKGICVVCSDLGYGCNQFPTFGLEDKQIPGKIKELLSKITPF